MLLPSCGRIFEKKIFLTRCTILAREAVATEGFSPYFVDFCTFLELCGGIALDFRHAIPWPVIAVDF